MIFRILILATVLCAGIVTADDSLRCGSKLVSNGMSMAEVRKYCGEPSSSSIEEQDVRAGNRVVGKTQIHIWHYARSSRQNTAVLRFDQDKLMSIQYISK